MTTTPRLSLGAARHLQTAQSVPLHVPAHHLVTHGVVVGMTGSGKTGLVTVMVEEALRSGIPVLAFDVKGDLPNLLLAFPSFSAEHVRPWTSAMTDPADMRSDNEVAAATATERQQCLEAWNIEEADLDAFRSKIDVRIITRARRPGSRSTCSPRSSGGRRAGTTIRRRRARR